MSERSPRRSSNGAQSQNSINREPATGSGTIRSNLERYRPDSVSAVKARQTGRPSGNRQNSRVRKASLETMKRQKRKKLIIRLAVLVFVILICVACFMFTYKVFYDVPLNEKDTTKHEIVIPDENISDEEVAKLLVDAGCINDARLYKLRTFIYDANYVPGTYSVSPSYSTEKIINILSGYDYSNGMMEEN